MWNNHDFLIDHDLPLNCYEIYKKLFDKTK